MPLSVLVMLQDKEHVDNTTQNDARAYQRTRSEVHLPEMRCRILRSGEGVQWCTGVSDLVVIYSTRTSWILLVLLMELSIIFCFFLIVDCFHV